MRPLVLLKLDEAQAMDRNGAQSRDAMGLPYQGAGAAKMRPGD